MSDSCMRNILLSQHIVNCALTLGLWHLFLMPRMVLSFLHPATFLSETLYRLCLILHTHIILSLLQCWHFCRISVRYFWHWWSDKFLTCLQQFTIWNQPYPISNKVLLFFFIDEQLSSIKWPVNWVKGIEARWMGEYVAWPFRYPKGFIRDWLAKWFHRLWTLTCGRGVLN